MRTRLLKPLVLAAIWGALGCGGTVYGIDASKQIAYQATSNGVPVWFIEIGHPDCSRSDTDGIHGASLILPGDAQPGAFEVPSVDDGWPPPPEGKADAIGWEDGPNADFAFTFATGGSVTVSTLGPTQVTGHARVDFSEGTLETDLHATAMECP